jgi:hypothetical protein
VGSRDTTQIAVAESVTVAFEGDDLGVVDQAIDCRAGDDVVAEDLTPPNRSWHMFVWP